MELNAKNNLLKNLEEIKTTLSENNDIENECLPIEEMSYQNMKAFLKTAEEQNLAKWDISADTNGTLLLSSVSNNVMSVINIGNHTMTYVVSNKKNNQSMSWRGPYSIDNAIRSLIAINKWMESCTI